jgi:hypothetical protein
MRREAAAAHHARINARHAIQTTGDPKVEAARLRAMDERAAAAAAKMDAANGRVIEGSLLHTKQRAALTSGSEGFKFK